MLSPSSDRHSAACACRVPAAAHRTGITAELPHLVHSAEPAVVFSSLAHLCVPTFSDACTIDIIEDGAIAYRIAYHGGASARADSPTALVSGWSVSTPFTHPAAGHDDAGYIGVMTHRWQSRRPSAADRDRAAVLARQGLAAVAEQRHVSGAHHRQDTLEHGDSARTEPVSAVTLRRLGCRGFRTGSGR